MWETWVQSLGCNDSLEKGMATHSSILAWRIPWTVLSMGSQRARTQLSDFHFHLQIASVPMNFSLALKTGVSFSSHKVIYITCGRRHSNLCPLAGWCPKRAVPRIYKGLVKRWVLSDAQWSTGAEETVHLPSFHLYFCWSVIFLRKNLKGKGWLTWSKLLAGIQETGLVSSCLCFGAVVLPCLT